MSEKNSHYKLDFKIKRDKPLTNLTFSHFRARYYWQSDKWNIPVLSGIYKTYRDNNKLSELIPANFDIAKEIGRDFAAIDMTESEQKDFFNYAALGHEAWFKNLHDPNGYVKVKGLNSSSADKYRQLLMYLVTKTEEYKKYEDAFQVWLTKRPGIMEVWDELYDDKPDLIQFAKKVGDGGFRSKVENARPRKLKIGTLVQLKDCYINNRSRDPFYWDQKNRSSPRLGMISKFNENHAFGYGSRLLKIMWIANSQETEVMERDLKILSE